MDSFRLQNIKSFKDTGTIELKPITILVGRNSCGKSSLLRFPAVMAQTACTPGNDPPVSLFGNITDYGNFNDIIYKKEGKQITFSLEYLIDINPDNYIYIDSFGHLDISRVANPDFKSIMAHAKLSVTLEQYLVNREFVRQVDLEVDNQLLSSLKWNDADRKYHLKLTPFSYGDRNFGDRVIEFTYEKSEINFYKFFPEYERDINSFLNAYGLEETPENRKEMERTFWFQMSLHRGSGIRKDAEKNPVIRQIQNGAELFDFSTDIMERVKKQFVSEGKLHISYIGPFRKAPERIYRYSGATIDHVGAKGENISDMLISFRRGHRNIYTSISRWVEKNMGYKIDMMPIGNNYYQMTLVESDRTRTNIMDVGFGISQVLPIVSEVFMMGYKDAEDTDIPELERNLILIEQPELHLHPAAQASLAELFATCVTTNPHNQLIIETHSEHLINKLQVLIADENEALTNEMVQILYVDKKDGQTIIGKMNIKENGRFETAWPVGFFDQGYELARELLRKSSVQKGSTQNE